MDSQMNHQELFILIEGNKQKEVYSTKKLHLHLINFNRIRFILQRMNCILSGKSFIFVSI